MNFKAIIRQNKGRAAAGAGLAVLLGLQLWYIPAGQTLADLSYDLPMLFTEPGAFPEIVLVEMDEASHTELRQEYGKPWDHRLHARLLDYLHNAGASLVVFDVVFLATNSDASATRDLAQAIRDQGRVVLAAGMEKKRRPGIIGAQLIPPIDELRAATTNWGPAQATLDADGVVRRIFSGMSYRPALSWVAAALAGATVTRSGTDHSVERWVRYYGPGGTLPRVSYFEATNRPPAFFRGKTVFIGGWPSTRFVTEEVDEFPTPWQRRGQPLISGLELKATEFLNLTRGDFLRQLSRVRELCVLVLFGVLFGGGLVLARPLRATLLALGGIVAVAMLALVLFFQANLWFDWCVIALVQIPVALAWSLAWHWRQLKKEKEWLEAPLPEAWNVPLEERPTRPLPAGAPTPAHSASPMLPEPGAAPAGALPAIPDHELLRQVGRGAYGDVWLARDALGSFHAVKIVRRETFEHTEPYEREFRGLQKFTPLSRAHPGLVHILHVGRNARAGYFYYVMEAGDDEQSGPTIDPLVYTPRNLGRDLRRRAPLPLHECVELGGALCDALEFLHRQGLIHRDIKPPNIIFVNGRPKLADIGLVTDIASSRRQVSIVGTEGYLPPEGPGTVAGDVYALGKVVQEMTQRRAAGETRLVEGEVSRGQTGPGWEQLRAVIRTACSTLPEKRFTSAQAMREALLQVAIVQ